MTVLDTSGHRLAKHPATMARPQVRLRTAEGGYLHQDLAAATLTANRHWAWQGTLEQMRRTLAALPAELRAALRPVSLSGLPVIIRRRRS